MCAFFGRLGEILHMSLLSRAEGKDHPRHLGQDHPVLQHHRSSRQSRSVQQEVLQEQTEKGSFGVNMKAKAHVQVCDQRKHACPEMILDLLWLQVLGNADAGFAHPEHLLRGAWIQFWKKSLRCVVSVVHQDLS